MPTAPALDLSPITDFIIAAAPIVAAAVGVVMVAAAGVGLLIWAWPKFLGLFKRSAK